MRPLSWITGVLALALVCLADTEIRNFHLPLSELPVPVPASAIPLSYKQRSQRLSFSSISSESWILLEPSRRHRAWTARLSWPGSSPTNFSMSLSPVFAADADRRIALHITSSPLSPSMPHPLLDAVLRRTPKPVDGQWSTEAELVFEPLVLGLIPKTTLPAIGWIVVFAAGAAFTVPYIIRFLEGAKQRADKEEVSARTDGVAAQTGKKKTE